MSATTKTTSKPVENEKQSASVESEKKLREIIASGLLAGDIKQFQEVVQSLRDDYEELDPLGAILLEQLVIATTRLRRSTIEEQNFDFGDPVWIRYHTMAERGFWKAVDEWRKFQKSRPTAPESAPVDPNDRRADPPNAKELRRERIATPLQNWSDRLVFDPVASSTSPVLKGTRRTVEHFMSLVADDWPIARILEYHPDITLEDLGACLAYERMNPGGGVDYGAAAVSPLRREPP